MSRSIGRKVTEFSILHNASKLTIVPFSSSSSSSSGSSGGHGRGRGRGGSPPRSGPIDFTSRVPGQDESKQQPIDSQITSGLGHGHGRGKPTSSSPNLPSFSVKSPSVGRGRGTDSPPNQFSPDPGSLKGFDSEPNKKPVFSSKDNVATNIHLGVGENNLPESLLSVLSGYGRGKPTKEPVPEAPIKQENRHVKPRQGGPAGREVGGRGGGPRMSRDEAVKNALRILSKGGEDVEVGGGGRGGRGGSGGFRGRGGRFRGRGRGAFRTGERGERGRFKDTDDGYAAGLYLGDNADGEKLAKKIGTEYMNQLVEGFEEMSGRVLPSPLEEEYLEGVHTNYMIECEPEYLVGDFESNPDIDEKPPISLRDALEEMKPFLMAYEGIQSHEEWEEIMEETMERVPLMKEIVDYYSGPDRVTAKQQQEELERVAKTLPESAPNSIKQFTNRAVLSLQSNPGWGFDKKCQFMDKLVRDFSQHYK